MIKKIFVTFVAVTFVYLCSYCIFRQKNTQIWEVNNKPYVIFPKDNLVLYYLYRPLSIIDSKMTGIGIHIGPHR